MTATGSGSGRAVVLGGGGLSGVAWLTGLLSAFEADGVSLSDADLVVGTSAGSVVATQLVAGRPFAHLYHFLSSPHVPLRTALIDLYGLAPKPDPEVLAELMANIQRGEASTPESRALVGAAALTTRTMREPVWVALMAAYIHRHRWPGPALGITTVDAGSGDFRVIARPTACRWPGPARPAPPCPAFSSGEDRWRPLHRRRLALVHQRRRGHRVRHGDRPGGPLTGRDRRRTLVPSRAGPGNGPNCGPAAPPSWRSSPTKIRWGPWAPAISSIPSTWCPRPSPAGSRAPGRSIGCGPSGPRRTNAGKSAVTTDPGPVQQD